MKTLLILSALISLGCAEQAATLASAKIITASGALDGTYILNRVDCGYGNAFPNTDVYSSSSIATLTLAGSSLVRTYAGACTITERGTITFAGTPTPSNFSVSGRSFTSSTGALCNVGFNLTSGQISPITYTRSSGADSLPLVNRFMYVVGNEVALRQYDLSAAGGLCYEIYRK